MSSYHIINAIWVGVFPMLAVTLIIGVVCYILCCLNQIKIRFKEHRKKTALKRARKKYLKQRKHELKMQQKFADEQEKLKSNCIQKTESFVVSKKNLDNLPPSIPNYISSPQQFGSLLPATPSSLCTDKNRLFRSNLADDDSILSNSYTNKNMELQYTPDRSALMLNLNPGETNNYKNHAVDDSDINNNRNVFKPISRPLSRSRTSVTNQHQQSQQARIAADLNRAQPSSSSMGNIFVNNRLNDTESEIEQLIVQELKESPKSAFYRLQSVTRLTNHASGTEKPLNTKPSEIEIKKAQSLNLNPVIINIEQDEIKKDNRNVLKMTTDDDDDNDDDDDDDDYNNSTQNDYDNNYSSDLNTDEDGLFKLQKLKDTLHGQGNRDSDSIPVSRSLPLSSSSNKRSKLLNLHKNNTNSNRILSDIDLDEDLIFNDDDDSLSSTGLCAAGLSSQNTLVFNSLSQKNSLSNLNYQRKMLKNENKAGDDEDTDSFFFNSDSNSITNRPNQSQATPTTLKSNTSGTIKCSSNNPTNSNSLSNNMSMITNESSLQSSSATNNYKTSQAHSISSAKHMVNSSSMSDIDPDENILKNLLIKSSATNNNNNNTKGVYYNKKR